MSRPSRPLFAKQPRARAQKIMTRNAAESHFLKLPAEIRNRIYNEALGGHTVHIDVTKFRGSSICACPAAEELQIQSYMAEGPDAIIAAYETVHEKCVGNTRYTVNLLLVCRQIYQEAALIPYSENIFAVDEDIIHLSDFLDKRLPAQKKAIKALAVTTTTIYRRPTIHGNQANSLTGLRKLTVRIATRPWLLKSRYIKAQVTGYLQKFGRGQLESASVLIVNEDHWGRPQRRPQQYRDLSAELAAKLVKSKKAREEEKVNRLEARKKAEAERRKKRVNIMREVEERRKARGLRPRK